ncbi:flocculation protein FLO11-like isoform X2 [Apis florea]|uniref:flocculation protein FLO11-like isoform X2 n=1 Tax=Apis florea TaxID=7463 RepID=UPI000252BF90|nr:flocculation protein FLO11-like isoform X2 [Apis florea]
MGAWMSWLILLQLSSVFVHGYDNVGFDGWYQPVPHRPVDIITDVINDLGVRILQQYTAHGNVAFSPTGVGFVLAALYEGSAGRGRQQIVDALGLPRDRDITRIGFRDIHRRLRTYLNADGFLGGLTLNHENTRLRPEYEDILRFYGFDLSIPEEEMNETTFAPETTSSVAIEQSTTETKTVIPDEITTQSITTQGIQSFETITNSGTPISTTSSVELTGIVTSSTIEQDKLTQTTPAASVLTNNPNAAMTTVSSSIVVTSSSTETTTTSSIPTIINPNLITTSSSEIVTTTPSVTSTPPSTIPSTTPIIIITTVASTISEEPQTTIANLTQPITTVTLSNQSPSIEESTSTLSTSTSTSTTPFTTTTTTSTTTSTTSIPSSTSETPLPPTTLIIVETPESTTISTGQTTKESVVMTESIPESTIMPPTMSAPINAGATVTEVSTTLPVNITEISTNSTIPTTIQTNEMSINETSRFTNKPDDENTISVDSLNNQSSISNEMESTELPVTIVAGEIGSTIGQKTITTTVSSNTMMNRRKRSDRSPRGFFSSYPDEGIWMQDLGIWKPYSTSLNEASVRDSTEISFLVNGCDVSSVTASRYFAVLPFAYFPSLHAVALEFPLDDPRYNIILMMATDRRDTYRLARDLGGKSLRLLRKQLQATWVRATIPSFMLRGFVTLTSFLQRLGILDVFEPRTADLSPMTPDLGVYARDVQQSIGVNIRNYMKPDRTHSRNGLFERAGPVPFTVVHPFLYFIVDAETSVVLIAGRVNDPLNSRIL